MADQKITQLTELTSVALEDLLVVVDDPSGTPVTKKITLDNILDLSQRKVFYTVGSSNADYITDGTDDDVQIQSAIDAAETAGGGIVHLKEGTYTIGATITIPSNIVLQGDGASSVIVAENSFVGTDGNMIVNDDTTSGNVNITIRNLKIDGNHANRTDTNDDDIANNIMFIKVSYSLIDSILSVNGYSSNLEIGAGSHHNIVQNSSFKDSRWHNFLLLGSTTGPVETHDNIISNCTFDNAGVAHSTGFEGVGIEIAKHCVRNTITGCVSSNNSEGGIHLFYKSNHNTITGCVFYNNGRNAIAIVDESDYNTIADNVIDSPGQVGINAVAAFLTYGGYYNNITGNTILNCGYNGISGKMNGGHIADNYINNCGDLGTGNQQYGISMDGATRVTIIGNVVANATNRGVYLRDLTKSIVSENLVYDSGAQGIFFDYSSTGADDCVVIGNYIENTPGAGIIFLRGAERCTISNNVIKAIGSTGTGLDLRGASYCTISGNTVQNCTAYGVKLQNDSASTGCSYNVFTDNIVTLNTSGGVQESGNSNNNLIAHNNFNNNTAANIATVGAATILFNNLGSTSHNLIGSLTISADLSIGETAYFDAVTDNGNSGTADTINWGTGNKQKSTLTGNCTYTFTAPSGPASLQLIITNDSTGGYDITWPASAKWLGTEPTWTSGGANKTIIVSMLYDGTNYWMQATPWET